MLIRKSFLLWFLLSCVLCSAAVFVGCKRSPQSTANGDQVAVVALTPQLADLARVIGGPDVTVEQLIPNQTDPHHFEPKPSDIAKLSSAKLILRSGGEIDAWFPEVQQAAQSQGKVLNFETMMQKGAADQGHPEEHEVHSHQDELDPHWWQNPQLVIRAVLQITGELEKLDPKQKASYRKRAQAYLKMLNVLDVKIAKCFQAIPKQKRKLATNHDGLGYYIKRYQLSIVGVAIPGRSTEAQSSLRHVNELVATLRREDVTTIFPEENVSPKLAAAIAKQANIRLGPELWVDTLAKNPRAPGGTYLSALRFNTKAILAGLWVAKDRLPAICQKL